jgi:hypothetical protein
VLGNVKIKNRETELKTRGGKNRNWNVECDENSEGRGLDCESIKRSGSGGSTSFVSTTVPMTYSKSGQSVPLCQRANAAVPADISVLRELGQLDLLCWKPVAGSKTGDEDGGYGELFARRWQRGFERTVTNGRPGVRGGFEMPGSPFEDLWSEPR